MIFFLPSNFKFKFIVFFLVVILSQKGVASMSTSDTVTLAVKGKTTILNCKLQLLKVLSDNRCPLNTRCIVAGAVSCQVRVNGVKQVLSSAVPATLNGENGAQYTLEIKDANPLPTAGVDNNYPKYKVTFEVHQK
jgi:hypothetical protein